MPKSSSLTVSSGHQHWVENEQCKKTACKYEEVQKNHFEVNLVFVKIGYRKLFYYYSTFWKMFVPEPTPHSWKTQLSAANVKYPL
jgi:hypothetical protein